MNPFDNMRDSMFDTVTTTMGYTATWQPSTSGAQPQSAQVLYKDSTEPEKMDDQDYQPSQYRMEYRKPLFSGLRELVDNGSRAEVVTIILPEGAKSFYVESIDTAMDGRTIIANLQTA